MNSTNKGDELEDKLYNYLVDQKNRGLPVFDAHSPDSCKIYKKKRYYCNERDGNVTFDVVIEVYRKGREEPYLFVVFECKNHKRSISEDKISVFSDQLSRVFRDASKGVFVVSSRLQSGAESIARKRKIGIVKYNDSGLETIADRLGCFYVENDFVASQIFKREESVKSLKFSAYYDGVFFGSLNQFLREINPEAPRDKKSKNKERFISIPYLPSDVIKNSTQVILNKIDYSGGAVDLEKICSILSIDLNFTDQEMCDADGRQILGSANFDRNLIQINANGNEKRERFTLGHEIGHFCLNHKNYLRSETIIERDLLISGDVDRIFNYERLEFQANSFSSNLLLPDEHFRHKTDEYRHVLEIKDRGHGYIFVDDQHCNYIVYDELLSKLSNYFKVSKRAIEIKLNNLCLVTDKRKSNISTNISQVLTNSSAFRKV